MSRERVRLDGTPAISFRVVETEQGACWFVCGTKGLLRSGLPEKSAAVARSRLRRDFPDARENPRLAPELARALQRYFAGRPAEFEIELDFSGLTEFRTAVYRELRQVPRGKTLSYKELARRVGRPRAARGVGLAMRTNPFAPIVPCHRVCASGGGLGGFSASRGLELKRWMLASEEI